MLAQTPEPSKKSKPVVVKHEEPRPLESFPWHSLEVWVSMTTLLWPEAEWGIKSGPMDALYTPLTQSEINELIAYWRANKQPFLYVDDVWDCDDFALDMFFLSRVWSMKRTQGQSPMPAVGMAFVKITGCYELMRERHFIPGTAYHVINVILREDGQWFFFEPQSGKLMPIESHLYEGSVEAVKIHI